MAQLTDHVKKICRLGQGLSCCRYLLEGKLGFECAKVDRKKKLQVDLDWEINKVHTARGDNCAGIANLDLLNKRIT